MTPGTRDSSDITGGTQPTETEYACSGFIDTLNRNRITSTLVQEGDVLINLVGDSIADGQVPEPGDKITIRGTTYNVIMVNVDPADALYSCVSRSN